MLFVRRLNNENMKYPTEFEAIQKCLGYHVTPVVWCFTMVLNTWSDIYIRSHIVPVHGTLAE